MDFKNAQNLSGRYTVRTLFYPSPLPQPPTDGSFQKVIFRFFFQQYPRWGCAIFAETVIDKINAAGILLRTEKSFL
jgi:hypothetical protein